MKNAQKLNLIRIAASALILAVSFHPNLPLRLNPVLCISAYLLSGYDVIFRAVRNLFSGKLLDENFLMTLATSCAFILGEYPEAAAVMLFFQVGELFQDIAVGKSRASIAALMDIRPQFANLENEKGEFTKTDPALVPVQSTIVVMPGEKIPLDGIVISGHSSLDLSALTGESLPKEVHEGQSVLSGSLNLSGLLRVKTSTTYEDSTVARILDLVHKSPDNKAQSEKFITRFARYYTPCVVALSVLLAVFPPLFFGGLWSEWIHRALVFLVISCPCALVISIPLSFFSGIGCASRHGILVKGAHFMESLAKIRTLVFDKTGTLTQGVFSVQQICPVILGEEQRLLELASLAECFSPHPIAAGIRHAYGQEIDPDKVEHLENIDGEGICAIIEGRRIYVGNEKLMKRAHCVPKSCHCSGLLVHLAYDDCYLGHIVLSDSLKENVAAAINALHKCGIKHTVILTGDRADVAHAVAQKLGINEYYAELLPQDKVTKIQEIQKRDQGTVGFVGDGINDAPVLKNADIGIAMGAIGSDAAIEAADVVLMDDNPFKIATAIRISKRTLCIVRQNIALSIGIKILVLALGTFGLANMWEAVFADVGVTVIAVLNAIRAMYLKKTE